MTTLEMECGTHSIGPQRTQRFAPLPNEVSMSILQPLEASTLLGEMPGTASHRPLVRVLLSDDSHASAVDLRRLIAADQDLAAVGHVVAAHETLHQAQDLQPDVVVLDRTLSHNVVVLARDGSARIGRPSRRTADCRRCSPAVEIGLRYLDRVGIETIHTAQRRGSSLAIALPSAIDSLTWRGFRAEFARSRVPRDVLTSARTVVADGSFTDNSGDAVDKSKA